jgi:hypothetical protein
VGEAVSLLPAGSFVSSYHRALPRSNSGQRQELFDHLHLMRQSGKEIKHWIQKVNLQRVVLPLPGPINWYRARDARGTIDSLLSGLKYDAAIGLSGRALKEAALPGVGPDFTTGIRLGGRAEDAVVRRDGKGLLARLDEHGASPYCNELRKTPKP